MEEWCLTYIERLYNQRNTILFLWVLHKESENRLKSTHRVHQSDRNLQTICIFPFNEKIIHDYIIYNYLVATYLTMLICYWMDILYCGDDRGLVYN